MFCSSCGTKIWEGEYFCTNCGKQAVQKPVKKAAKVVAAMGAAPAPAPAPAKKEVPAYESGDVRMTTQEEVMEFFEYEMKYAEKYLKKYEKYVPQLVESLMPGEYITFAFVAAQNISVQDNGGMHGYAMTNRRMIISYPSNALYEINAAMKGQSVRHGIEVFTYNQIVGVSKSIGLLLGNITINFSDGSSGTLNVDKGWTEKVYKGIYNAIVEFGSY